MRDLSELPNQIDTIQGCINRLHITNELAEYLNMCKYVHMYIDRLYVDFDPVYIIQRSFSVRFKEDPDSYNIPFCKTAKTTHKVFDIILEQIDKNIGD